MGTGYRNEYKEVVYTSDDGSTTVTLCDTTDYLPSLYAHRKNPQTGSVCFFKLRAYVVRRPTVKWEVYAVKRIRMNRPYQLPKFHWPGRKWFSFVTVCRIASE